MTTLGSGYQYSEEDVSSAGTYADVVYDPLYGFDGRFISFDTTVDGITVDAGGKLDVGYPLGSFTGGGTASDTIVNSGGELRVYDGTATDTVVNSGGFAFASGGGILANTAVNGGYLGVMAGSASGTIVDSGGRFDIGVGNWENDASAIGTTVSNGGALYIQSAPAGSWQTILSNTTIDSGGFAYLAGYLSTTGFLVDDGVLLYDDYDGSNDHPSLNLTGNGSLVVRGAFVLSGTLNFAGAVVVGGDFTSYGSGTGVFSGQETLSAGTFSNTVVSWGEQDVELDAIASGTVIRNGSIQNVDSGGTARDTTLSSGTENVNFGGTAIRTTVFDGSEQLVAGTAVSTIVSSGGTLLVSNGGVASNTQLYAHGPAGEAVLSGGKTYNETVFAGGGESVRDGGISFDAVISSGGTQNVGLASISGGVASHTTVSGGGRANVISGGTTVSAVLIGAGTSQYAIESVSGGGTASATSITNTGELIVSSGGVASDTVVNSTLFGVGFNGGLFVESGGSSINAQINSSGLEVVFSGGTDSNTTVAGGGFLTVSSGGVASDTEVNGGGVLTVVAGGVTVSAALLGSGTAHSAREILSGGVASDTSVTDTGKLVVLSGGVASGTVVNSTSFGAGSNGGLFVSSGGSSINADINSGGVEVVFLSGRDSNTTVDSGGFLTVSSGGVASDTEVNGGGVLTVVSGGSSLSAALLGSGTAHTAREILSGGVASDTTITDTGKLVVLSGGVASDTVVNSTLFGTGSNGGLFVSSGGSAIGTKINSGGVEVVFSSGQDSGTTVSDGGFLTISSGGIASGTNVESGGDVIVQGGGSANAVVVDDGGFLYVSSGGTASGATIDSGGFAYVESGGSEIGLLLNGGEVFDENQSDDLDATINSGGVEYVESGGVSISSTVNDGGYEYVLSGGVASDTILNDPGVQVVSSGGKVVNPTINGGKLELKAGAMLSGTISFGASPAGVLQIDATGFNLNINGFVSGDVIDFYGLGDLTLAAGIDTSGVRAPGQVNLYSQGGYLATLNFSSGAGYKLLEPMKDGAGGTEIVVDSAPASENPAGTKIDWSFVHGWESPGGVTQLLPYVSTGFSGLTMAQGVDIGDQGNKSRFFIQDLFGDWQNNPNLSFIDEFAGRDHLSAVSFLLPQANIGGNPTSLSASLTTTEANAITLEAETETYDRLSSDYTAAAAQYGNGGWDTLSSDRQTAIFDLAYNIGLQRNPPQHYGIEDLQLWTLLAKQDWANASVRMAHTGGDLARRAADAIKLFNGPTMQLPTVEAPQVIASNEASYSFLSDASTQYALDPTGPYLTLQVDPGSPKVQSLELPSQDVADHYLVSYEIGATWSTPQAANPDDILTFATGGVDGLKIAMLDSNGHALQGNPEFTFFLSFASAGNFSGTVFSTSTTAVTDNGVSDVNAGHTVTISISDGLPLTVTGSPTLALSNSEVATYIGGSGTQTLTFSYTVQPGDDTSDLLVNGLNLSGDATISDVAGNPFTDVAQDLGLQIDTTPPQAVIPIFATPSSGIVGVHQDIKITMSMTEPVVVAGGVPGLLLNDGGVATYDSAASEALNDPDKLVFDYVVGANDADTAALAIVGFDAKGATVHDFAGNNANLSGFKFTFDDLQIETGNVACYCFGTLIETGQGPKRVELLKIGDEVRTHRGGVRPIKWIGKRSYSGRFALGQKHILPICIRAGALNANIPRRDLWILPHHAMYLEGVLIEAKDLVNGVSVVQAEQVENVEYFHIELDTHDVIFAEGALSETFVDDDSRGMFHNAHEYARLYPEEIAGRARYCAPRLCDGYIVQAVRDRLEARAGLPRTAPLRTPELRGYIDIVDSNLIAGWAQSIDHPETPVCLDILANGQLIGQALANRYREDLQSAGLGSGRHGFEFALSARPDIRIEGVEVRRSLDGAAVHRSEIATKTICRGARLSKPIAMHKVPLKIVAGPLEGEVLIRA
ncbi:MAG: AIDA repeat-containing protein [Bradyrhizobium sp.]